MHRQIDVTCIGALNVDYVATQHTLHEVEHEKAERFSTRFDRNAEDIVRERDVDAAIEDLGAENFDVCLGGSAYNTARILALLDAHSIAYAGVAGRTPLGINAFIEELQLSRIAFRDTVRKSSARTGVCVSFIDDEGERSLLTYPGANTECAKYFQSARADILALLRRTKIVHVTSFFDPQTPRVLADILREAKRECPQLKMSFDPGTRWTTGYKERRSTLRPFLEMADFLFLNYEEFKNLGLPARSDEARAKRIIGNREAMVIVLKEYNLTKVFCPIRGARAPLALIASHGKPKSASEITDSTGAGDAFAAGFIATLLNPAMGWREGAVLGHRIALEKLATTGVPDRASISQAYKTFLDEFGSGSDYRTVGRVKAFIGHGRSIAWLQFKHFLTERLGLECIEFNDISVAGEASYNRVKQMLREADVAFLVMTAEAKQKKGELFARQNVIHELGLFQSKLGQEKAIMLLEKGCTPPSNLDGLGRIQFTRSNLPASFEPIRMALEAAGIIVPTSA